MHTGPQSQRAPRTISVRQRLPFVDWARGAAYVLMVTAHVAPNDGPARILLVSEFITAPLYALLIGAGTQLGWSAAPERGGRYVLRATIRAVVVFMLGLLLAASAAQVLVVLTHLAAVMVLSLPLVRLRTHALVVAAGFSLILAVGLPMTYQAVVTAAATTVDYALLSSPLLHVLALSGGTGPYRLSGFLLCSIVGMLAIRALRRLNPKAWLNGAAASVTAFGGMLALLVAPNILGWYEVHADDGSPSEQIGSVLGALGVLLSMWTIQASPAGRSLPERATRMLAAPGQAGITLYSLHILILHIYQMNNPTERDDHWWMLALLVAAGVLFAILWQAVLRSLARNFPTLRLWVLGPIEGLIRAVQALLLGTRRDRGRPVPAER